MQVAAFSSSKGGTAHLQGSRIARTSAMAEAAADDIEHGAYLGLGKLILALHRFALRSSDLSLQGRQSSVILSQQAVSHSSQRSRYVLHVQASPSPDMVTSKRERGASKVLLVMLPLVQDPGGDIRVRTAEFVSEKRARLTNSEQTM